jgi:hypothetical protein
MTQPARFTPVRLPAGEAETARRRFNLIVRATTLIGIALSVAGGAIIIAGSI